MVDIEFSLLSFEYFVLLLVRISSFVGVAPFFGMSNTPAKVKIGFSVFVSILVYGLIPQPELATIGMFEYSILVVKEVITGLMIGFAANLCTYALNVAGSIADLHTGLSMATQFDPVTMTESAITGNMYRYLVLLLLVVTNMQHYILRAIVDSYKVIPIQGQNFDWDSLLSSMTMLITDIFVIGFRIVLPIFACIMILNCILGIMAKVAPQMNMFAVGIQLKILLGFFVMFVTIGLLPYVSDYIFTEMKKIMVSIIEGMY